MIFSKTTLSQPGVKLATSLFIGLMLSLGLLWGVTLASPDEPLVPANASLTVRISRTNALPGDIVVMTVTLDRMDPEEAFQGFLVKVAFNNRMLQIRDCWANDNILPPSLPAGCTKNPADVAVRDAGFSGDGGDVPDGSVLGVVTFTVIATGNGNSGFRVITGTTTANTSFLYPTPRTDFWIPGSLNVPEQVTTYSNVFFNPTAFTAYEADGFATLTAALNYTSSVPITVTYNLTDGTAIAPGDYPAGSGTFVIPAGVVTKAFTVPINNDVDMEGDETFSVTLTNSSGNGVLGSPDNAIVTIVDDDNQAPVITEGAVITPAAFDEDGATSFGLNATDAEDTASLTWNIKTPPAHGVATVSFVSGTATVYYTPTANYNGADSFVVQVVDNLGATASIVANMAVNPQNDNPILSPIGDKTVAEGTALNFTATATDPDTSDVPPQTLTYSMIGSVGAINATSGAFTFTPSEAQGPGLYPVTFNVSDGIVTATESITINVTEVNVAPVLAPIGPKIILQGTTLAFTATATDADLPANTLSFSLDAGSVGSIDASTGAFTYLGNTAGAFTATIRVTDNGTPALSSFETINIQVNSSNAPPVLAAIGPRAVNEGATLAFTATATDAEPLTFSLDPGSAGSISTAGAFTFAPTEAQGPGVFTATVRVSDGSLNDFETFTITVNEVNQAPVLTLANTNFNVTPGVMVAFTASATDADLPANALTFSLTGAPTGATINATTGAFAWTATMPGTYTMTVRVTDNGTPAMSDNRVVTIVVGNFGFYFPLIAKFAP